MGSVGDAALSLAQAVESESATPGKHLMVFSHGFMGRPAHLTTVIGALQALPDADKRLIIVRPMLRARWR